MQTSKLVRLTAVSAIAALALTACSDSESSDSANTDSSAASESADGNGSDAESNNPADESQFPITVEHALGETVIESKPERVATVGWANHEVPLAFGIVPVGMSKSTWGDDDENGIMPWTEDKIAELGGEEPVLFDETDGIPFEQVADTQPDVILAAYSGLTQEDYDTLSQIAPVVAYPDKPWTTSAFDMVSLDAAGLGLADEGEKLNEDLKKQVDDAMANYPELKGKKPLFTSFGGASSESMIGFYTLDDPRAGFLEEAGFETPEIVKEYTGNSDSFWEEVSTENPEQFDDVDFFISYSSGDEAADKEALEKMQADPLTSKIPAIAEGRVVFLENGPLGASANPSPLSIPWGIDDYFAALNTPFEAE
ncbi:MAG TPA: iron-siderophore ABC transporter substrate-binding protein [Corynebacterium stationis]|uniref:iron-siderophore ABC transporter substrate-binding protein n=1 Tax=Corynebacterium stationis TaxID=1705 RepID=UPI001D8EDD42|nr:iron-siderophore ABC transporter substrate-binding protein [Corynebacterium stationis]HJG63623.1 iron-siderophore ABC transporter substrate-binding protein [Corynebacterium stationis]